MDEDNMMLRYADFGLMYQQQLACAGRARRSPKTGNIFIYPGVLVQLAQSHAPCEPPNPCINSLAKRSTCHETHLNARMTQSPRLPQKPTRFFISFSTLVPEKVAGFSAIPPSAASPLDLTAPTHNRRIYHSS